MGAWEDGFAAGWAKAHGVVEKTASTAFILSEGKRAARSPRKRKRSRAPSAYNKRLGRALKRLNKRARKKDGSWRKAWNPTKVMRLAHKEAKK